MELNQNGRELTPKFTPDGRVNYEYVQEETAKLVFEVTHVPYSTLTIVSVFYEGFHLANGTSACVNPLNYNQDTGHEIATRNAREAAVNKLWELFGWELHNYLKQVGQLVDPSQLPKKSNDSIRAGYPALLELQQALDTYNGQLISQSRHDANTLRLKDSGKKFAGHTIYFLDNGGPHYIILSTSDSAGQSYLYIAVTEPMLYQLQEMCVKETMPSANAPLIPTNGNIHPRQG